MVTSTLPLNTEGVIRSRQHARLHARPRLQTDPSRALNHTLAWNVPPVPSIPSTGITAGTWLAIGTTAVSALVLLDPKASKEAKAIAQLALGTALPFLLNKAFELETWPA